ncbi:MAG: RNA polymerase sigma-70 factor [candidate division KSB1 bacterium]|nr:RNA polymerase sigma-70 factor [candidate division KSB1 bacterium]
MNDYNTQSNIFNLEAVNIKDGDIQAFERCYRYYCQKLIEFACYYVKDIYSAENIVQDVFLNLWQNRDKIDPSSNLKSYIYKATKNRALKVIRKQNTEQKYRNVQEERIIYAEFSDAKVLEKELDLQLNNAIDGLPEKCRIIFCMNRYNHLTYREIASVLDISVKTVETQMGRALKILRRKLAHLFVSVFI